MSKPKLRPPQLADRFLSWFCDEALLEEIQGDLHEAYDQKVKRYGLRKANRWYWWEVLKFFKPFFMEGYSRSKQFLPNMSNYFKIASRNLLKRKSWTLFNLGALAAGMAVVMMVFLYLQHEYSYDSYYDQGESGQTYKLVNNYRDQAYSCMSFPGYFGSSAGEQQRLVEYLQANSSIAQACQFIVSDAAIGPNTSLYLRAGGKKLVVDQVLYTNTGSAFLSVFPQQFLQQNAAPLGAFDQALITATMARRIFGADWQQQSILGELLELEEQTYQITGVIEDPPANTHFDFEVIINRRLIPSWGAYTYITVEPGADAAQVLEQINRQIETVYPGYKSDILQKGVTAIALADIHFTPDTLYEFKPIANTRYLSTFALAAGVILLIIVTNYTNTAMAVYTGRQREIGVRKVMGARPRDIALQIIAESLLLTLLCLPIACLLLSISLPMLQRHLGIVIAPAAVYSWPSLLFLLVMVISIAVLSAAYPALLFSKKELLRLFKARWHAGGVNRRWNLRYALLSIQFFVLIALLSISFTIGQQMDYIAARDPGFIKENVLYFSLQGKEEYQLMREVLTAMPEVEGVGSGLVPGQEMYNQLTYQMHDAASPMADGTHLFTSLSALEVLGIEHPALRTLRAGADSVFLINETAARKLAASTNRSPEQLIGQKLILEPEYENATFGQGTHYNIAGIIPDFDYFNLKLPDQSLLLEIHRDPDWVYNMLVRLSDQRSPASIQQIIDAYASINPAQALDIRFLDQEIEQLYKQEQQAGQLIGLLTAISVILALMGLVAMVNLVTTSRQKEVGIRKVFGANLADLLYLFNKEYLLMLGMATLLAIPVSLYMASRWLESFARHIEPRAYWVLLAGALATLLIVLVVSWQSWSTARLNPSRCLRDE